MEEQNQGNQKPLRHFSNKAKDIESIYGKSKNIKISDNEVEKTQANQEIETIKNEKENLLEQIEKLNEQINDLNSEISSLNEKINNLTKEKEELKDQFIRKAAEFENYRKRSLEEKKEIIDYANEKLLAKFIELLDDLNSASEAGKNTTDIEAMNKGLEMITNKARKMFEDAGVKQMDNIIGKPFDVNYHEALMMTNSELPEGSIVQVVQPGYMLNDKVLRYAKVITSNGNSN